MFNKREIATTVLDCWAMYLNPLEQNQVAENPDKRVRVYVFGTTHCVAKIFLGLLKYKMFIIIYLLIYYIIFGIIRLINLIYTVLFL